MVKGIVTTAKNDGSERTDYLFRISLKAVIHDDQGRLLVVKEHGLNWGLPGGGLDHDESLQSALARELKEEVGYDGVFEFETIGTEGPVYVQSLDIWLVWIVFHVTPTSSDFMVGVDAEDMKFIDVDELLQYDDNQAQYARKFHDIVIARESRR